MLMPLFANLPVATLARWSALWGTLDAKGAPGPWYRRLQDAYGEASRAYHTLRHLDECLTEFDFVRHGAEDPLALEVALWFHDAVYDPHASDNEEQSAELAVQCLRGAGLAPDFVEKVRRLILVTKSHRPAPGGDEELMCDIDLAILGRETGRFGKYDAAIRKEYAWVPWDLYVARRAELLEGLLQRPSIFHTAKFRDKYEGSARRNLRRALEDLMSLV